MIHSSGPEHGLVYILTRTTGLMGGAWLGATTVITTVTATCIFFEIIGPILTRIGLKNLVK